MISKKWLLAVGCSGLLAFGVAACGDDDDDDSGSDGGTAIEGTSGTIAIDGSSTVQPFAEAAAELFAENNPDTSITVGAAGTGGGFEKFCAGETDISDASRPIDAKEEVPVCKENGIEYTEIQVANDGIAIATNPAVEISCLTTDQLKQLWVDDSVTNYSELGEDADTGEPLPDVEVSLYGPGTDSGTFDYFTDVINGEEGVSRKEYQPSEDDNQLVTGVAGDEGGARLLRILLLRAEPGHAEPRLGGFGRRLRRTEHGDDPVGRLHAAVAAAVHVPVDPRRSRTMRPSARSWSSWSATTRRLPRPR